MGSEDGKMLYNYLPMYIGSYVRTYICVGIKFLAIEIFRGTYICTMYSTTKNQHANYVCFFQIYIEKEKEKKGRTSYICTICHVTLQLPAH